MNRFLDEFRQTPQLLPLLALLIFIPAVFWSTSAAMIDVWLVNETFTHGFLILPISLWLIWQQRSHLRALSCSSDLRALVLLLPTLALWLFASLIDVVVVKELSMVASIPLTIWLVLGLPITLALLFPLCYLFFAIPLGQGLIPPMMELTADMTVWLIQHSGVPIFRDGLSFELPSGSWAVVEECSGVRYLIASAALGTIYAYITYRSFTKRAVFVLAALIVPIIANGIRAYGIVMIGHLSGMKYAVGADHLLYGWVFFGLIIFVLFWIGGLWADYDAPAQGSTHAGPHETRADSGSTEISARRGWQVPAVAALGLFLGLNLVSFTIKSDQSAPLLNPASLDLSSPSVLWSAVDAGSESEQWRPVFTNPDLSARQRFEGKDGAVTVDVAYFARQREGAEAISSLNRVTDPYEGEWKQTAQRERSVEGSLVVETEVSRSKNKTLVYSAYLVGDRYIASAGTAKLLQAWRFLSGEQDAAWVTVSTEFDAPLETVQARLDTAWLQLSPRIATSIAELSAED
ncbi:MAG: exosortase A [Pseudomonadota bacterium]